MNGRERFIKACKGEAVDRPPVWIMRQAGRYLPEYLKVREKHSFMEVCRTPELVAEVVMQPLRRFPLDAAILFSDILVVPEALGQRVDYPEGGPKLSPAIDNEKAINDLKAPDDIRASLGYVALGLQAIREQIGEEKALLGFSGAPYTLATYMIEGAGSKKYFKTKEMIFSRPALFLKLMHVLADTVASYLRMQAEEGADALQLFDTWAGELSPPDYERFVLPFVQRIVDSLADTGKPVIYFAGGMAGSLPLIEQSGAGVLGVDFRTSMKDVLSRLTKRIALQGNLDPMLLFGEQAEIRSRVRLIHDEMKNGHGHIMNLGHGVLPKTPIENVEAFVDETLRLGERA